MNVFASNRCPVRSALALCDRHVRSQIGETGRILATTLHRKGIDDPALMGKPYNPGGRFARWADESWGNFNWLTLHGFALGREHLYRFGTHHRGMGAIYAAGWYGSLLGGADLPPPTEWERCEAARRRASLDTFEAYRDVLSEKYETWGPLGAPGPRSTPPDWVDLEIRA
jgi:hypothetical protein